MIAGFKDRAYLCGNSEQAIVFSTVKYTTSMLNKYTNVTISMLYLCFIYALSMLHLCFIYASFMLHLCFIYASFMLHLCFIYASFMLHLCFIYASFMLQLCYIPRLSRLVRRSLGLHQLSLILMLERWSIYASSMEYPCFVLK
jgi:hypothetical protein